MLAGYLSHHTDALASSSGRLARAPFATLLTVLVIGLALALPLGFALVVSNIMRATGGFSGAVDLSVYFKPDGCDDPGAAVATHRPDASGVAARTGDQRG